MVEGMLEHMDSVLDRVQMFILSMGILIIVGVLLFLLILPVLSANGFSNSDVVISDSSPSFSTRLGQSVNSTRSALKDRFRSAGPAVAKIDKSVHHQSKLVYRDMRNGMDIAIGSLFDGIVFLMRIPGNLLGAAEHAAIASAATRASDHTKIPTITAGSASLPISSARSPESGTAAAIPPPVSVPAKQMPSQNVTPAWPIHGAITTLFGATDWPYESVHTGLDISDGNAPGVTPVHPFRPGRVLEAVHSSYGLGNHIVIDHGNGMTSVYGHLSSISVSVGQTINQNDLLGYEGTTGASTGTHLHFEIRLGGQPVNPLLYISGRP